VDAALLEALDLDAPVLECVHVELDLLAQSVTCAFRDTMALLVLVSCEEENTFCSNHLSSMIDSPFFFFYFLILSL